MEMRTTRRRFLRRMAVLGAGLALAGPMLAACGPTPTPKVIRETVVVEKPVTKVVEKEKVVKETVVVEKKVEVPAAKEKITIRFMCRAGEMGEFQRQASRQYEKTHPNITVKNEDHAWGDLYTKVLVQAAAGVLQDVLYGWMAAWSPYFYMHDVYLYLEDLAKADAFPLGIFYPYSIERATIDGHLIGLPTDAQLGGNMIYYNKDIFKAAGAKEPDPEGNWSFEQYLEQLVKIQKAGHWAVGRRAGGLDQDPTWYRCWKGDLIDQKTGKKCLWNTPETQTGFKYMYDRVHNWKVMPGKAQIEGDFRQMFFAGKIACYEDDCSRYTGMEKGIGGKFKVGIALLPKYPSGVIGTEGQANGFMVWRKTKYPEACWGLLKELTSLETNVWTVLETGKQAGPRIDAWHDPRILKNWEGWGLCAKLFDEGPQRFPWLANTRIQEFFDTYGQECNALLYADKPYNEANVEAMQKKLQAIVDMPVP